MRPITSLRHRLHLRLYRRMLQARAWIKGRSLRAVVDRTKDLAEGPILLSTVRNECVRLEWFLDHYRRLGVVHFLIVDNGSTDGTLELLRGAEDVSVWQTNASYKGARYGVDWLNHLLQRHGVGRWVLVADPDELLGYPYCDTRGLPALTGWLEDQGSESFPPLLLDMYGKGPISETRYVSGTDPVAAAPWFDSNNHYVVRDGYYRNLWIQGGPRMRAFFATDPKAAPALNKIPLVKWQKGFVFKTGAHDLLPRRLNETYAQNGGSLTSGVLLHTKFLDILPHKVEEEMKRRQHYSDSSEYESYAERGGDLSLWTPQSLKYRDWRQLCELGLMAKGGWL